MPLALWETSKQALLVCMSVIAAGVLVRLARGLPFTNADHYEVDEIRQLTSALGQIIRSLKALIIVVFVSMMALIFAKPLADALRGVTMLAPASPYIDPAISALLGLLVGYVLWRIYQVVHGDEDLTELQGKFVVRAVERAQAKRFEAQQARDAPDEEFKNPIGYGKSLPPS